MSEEPFSLAVVCTANRFRSPLAAALVRARAAGLPVGVRSYSTLGRSGVAALEQAVEAGAPLGVDLSRHVARRLQRGDLDGADLVLGFERAHVASAVVDAGALRGRTFTLPEFVVLAEAAPEPDGDGVRRARAVVQAAAAARAASPGRTRELADPAGGPEAGYRRAAAEVDALSARLVRALFGVSPTQGPD